MKSDFWSLFVILRVGGGIFSRENFIPVRIGFSQSILLCKSHAEWGSFSSGEGKAGGKVFKILTEYTPLIPWLLDRNH